VYRTLDVLEELGYLSHAHGADGREEYHVLPLRDHGHMYCVRCGKSWELNAEEVQPLAARLKRSHGFELTLSHLSVAGLCAECAD
jgi:Fur family ferric uptake transcriptional regulator